MIGMPVTLDPIVLAFWHLRTLILRHRHVVIV